MSWLWLAIVLPSGATLFHVLARRLGQGRRALASMQLRAERAEAALALVGAHVMVADTTTTIAHCGDRAAALLGPPSMTGSARGTPAPRWEGATLAALDHAFRPLRDIDEACELTLERDGRTLCARLVPLRGPGSGRCGYLVEWHDAGAERDQRLRETQLAQRRERDAAALAELDDGMMLADAELRIDSVNPALARMLAALGSGLAGRLEAGGARELLGAPLACFDGPTLQFDTLREPDAPASVATLDIDGRRFELRAAPLRDAGGRLLGAAVRWKDRTDAARLEAEILRVVGELNRYQLASRVPLEGTTGPLATLGAGLNQVGDSMAGIVSTVRALAAEVSVGAETIAEENRLLGEQAARAAGSLADTARSTRQVRAAIQQLTESAHLANRLSEAMRGSAAHGGDVVHGAREAMSKIDRTSRRMSDVVGVIDGIAFQTNLLALNAAIEAAHAGPLGGGFAVVAGEVRALAARSKAAAREVHSLIDETLRCVEAGSARVTQSEEALQEIIGSAQGVAEIIAQIDEVAVQQADGIERIDEAVLELERFTRGHNALVERTARASGALAEQSADLAGLMQRYRLPDVIVNAPKLRARKRAESPHADSPKAVVATPGSPAAQPLRIRAVLAG